MIGRRINLLATRLLLLMRLVTFNIVTLSFTTTSHALRIVVFGGSGFVGRRVCKTLVKAGCEVISISKSGKPPWYYCNDDDYTNNDTKNNDNGDSSPFRCCWADSVEWVQANIDDNNNNKCNKQLLQQQEHNDDDNNNDEKKIITQLSSKHVDAIVSCVGGINPSKEWKQLFGLGFDNDELRYNNGYLNERICQLYSRSSTSLSSLLSPTASVSDNGSSSSSSLPKFVYISVSYEVAKALEGPIEGYINGKRQAEHAACETFGCDNTIVLGPSLIYGGKRFPRIGRLYRSIVESPIIRSYIKTNDFLRNLSTAPLEDWLEKMILGSPPVDVDVVSKVVCAAALGLVTRDMVGQRTQGFFDTNGKPVYYDNVIFIDGTKEIERIEQQVSLPIAIAAPPAATTPSSSSLQSTEDDDDDDVYDKKRENKEPSFEGALIGKKPYLYPLPVIATFALCFWAVATQQYIQVVPR